MMKEIKIGDVFDTNNFGKFKIIGESKIRKGRSRCYDIEFIDTKSIRKDIARAEILRGEVKDYYKPKIAGVGYLGEGIMQKDYKLEYSIWKHMLHRCYNPKCDVYNMYGAKGVTVCERWHCFKNFVEDLPKIDGYNEELFRSKEIELDKDLKKTKPHKEYSLENCTFLSHKDNILVSKFQKMYRVKKFKTGFVGTICKK